MMNRAVHRQDTVYHGLFLFNSIRDIDQGLHIADHHADRQRQCRRRDPAAGRQPDGDHFITGRINIRQDMQTDRIRHAGIQDINGSLMLAFDGNNALFRAGGPHRIQQTADHRIRLTDSQLLIHLQKRLTFSRIHQIDFRLCRQFDVSRETSPARTDNPCILHTLTNDFGPALMQTRHQITHRGFPPVLPGSGCRVCAVCPV